MFNVDIDSNGHIIGRTDAGDPHWTVCDPLEVDSPQGGFGAGSGGGGFQRVASRQTPQAQKDPHGCPANTHYAPPQTAFPSDGPCSGKEICTAETPPNPATSEFNNPKSRYYSPPINTGGVGYDRYGNKFVRYNCLGKGGRSCSFVAGHGSMGYGVVTADLPSGPDMPTGEVNPFKLSRAPARIRDAAKANNQCVPN